MSKKQGGGKEVKNRWDDLEVVSNVVTVKEGEYNPESDRMDMFIRLLTVSKIGQINSIFIGVCWNYGDEYGAWATLINLEKGEQEWLTGIEKDATGNRLEITALIKGLDYSANYS